MQSLALCASLAMLAGDAQADTEEPPPSRYTPYVDRGMSVPAPYVYGTLGSLGTLRRGDRTMIENSLGVGFGLTSRLWIDGSVGTLKLAPKLGYHSPQIGLNALLIDTPVFELDVATHVTFAAEDGRPVEQIEPGFFSVLHLPRQARFDGGIYFDANPGRERTYGLRVPVSVGFQISEHVHASINSGVTIDNFADLRETTAVPLGITVGWSDQVYRGEGAPSVSVVPTLTFPELIRPGAREQFRPGYATLGITFVFVSQL